MKLGRTGLSDRPFKFQKSGGLFPAVPILSLPEKARGGGRRKIRGGGSASASGAVEIEISLEGTRTALERAREGGRQLGLGRDGAGGGPGRP